MEFKAFKKVIQDHFAKMVNDAENLFEVEVDKEEMWNVYLDSFPAGTNEIYRTRREYDCNCCKHFIRKIGNAVAIKDNKIHTIWELSLGDSTFQTVSDVMDAYIKSKPVTNIYVSKESTVGTDKTRSRLEDGTIETYEHYCITLPAAYVDKTKRSEGDIKGGFRDTKNVFKRSLDEITDDAVDTVLELIGQKSLYKGEEWKSALTEFKKYKKQYDKVPEELRENFCWEKSLKARFTVGRIRNHSMGVLLVDISNGVELDEAVRRYEAIVAPTNYKRPKAIYTKRMLEEAKKTVSELGYMDSLGRRFATLDDIKVNNILFSNKDAAKRIQSQDVFGEMEKGISVDPKKFHRVQEISIEDFAKNVLPTATSVEVFLENKHAANMVSLIAPEVKDSKTMFKWNNGFSWAYTGNITDSDVKQNVKMAGGKVDGVLRFSIQWNDVDYDQNDLDAHCYEPNGNHIFYPVKRIVHPSSGMLDVDIISPKMGVPAVENICWTDLNWMPIGTYKMCVHCFSYRGGKSGFRAEIEFNGEIHSFDYNKTLRPGEMVYVAEVTLNGDGTLSIKELLPYTISSRDVWGLAANQFHPVSVVMYSPNYWDEQNGIGNRHYLFMLNGCVNPENPNGFYNEFLKQELVQHKRVFEALGGKMTAKDADDQLSGIGFSSTRRNELVVKVKGATERILKIKF